MGIPWRSRGGEVVEVEGSSGVVGVGQGRRERRRRGEGGVALTQKV